MCLSGPNQPCPSFTYAQQGILYGVTAYLLRPLRAEDIEQVLEKLRASENPDLPFREAARAIVSRLWAEGAEESFFETGHKFITEEDPVRRSLRWREFYEAVISETFQTYPWLRLYHHPEEYSSLDYIRESDSDMVVGFCLRKLDGLSQSIRELFPIAKKIQSWKNCLPSCFTPSTRMSSRRRWRSATLSPAPP